MAATSKTHQTDDAGNGGAGNGGPGRAGRTLTFVVYERLRNDIMNGALTPGAPLRSEFLRQRYEVGNSPVREALNRLSAEGLVARRDQKGFQVASISEADLLETIKVRLQLEETALREAIAHGGTAWEEGLVLANYRLSNVAQSATEGVYSVNPDWERLHGKFHMALISACGSRWLERFCHQLMDRADRYRRLAFATHYADRDEVDEHRAITEAATGRRADEAVGLLKAHYNWTADMILKSLPALVER